MSVNPILKALGVALTPYKGASLKVRSPIDGAELASLKAHDAKALETMIDRAGKAFDAWRIVPAPQRGELIRQFGECLREHKEPLAKLVTLECGKILEEARGEVQEMIDICDFAVGLSRQLYGLTIASERPQHVMQENYLPLGPIAVISAFNFPVAVWAWNFALAIVCGDSVLWKTSEKTPLCAIACHTLFEKVCAQNNVPAHLSQLILGGKELGEQLAADKRIPLVSATGSTRMGRHVAPVVAQRFGKSLLELGGNNAIIVSKSADLRIALPSILFGAVGTAGQRCTTTRRLFAQRSIYASLCKQLKTACSSISKTKIGNPLKKGTLIGPLIDEASFNAMQRALSAAKKQGGTVFGGQRVLTKEFPGAYYVAPALVQMPKQTAIVKEETFAPILYVMPYDDLAQALTLHNAVPQGLSSAIFTTDIREAEYFKRESDCGIANVNIGTSGAEIGGAFGGEKDTGGGRESGSDSWKIYMRRQTSTTYFGQDAPALAQGITFG